MMIEKIYCADVKPKMEGERVRLAGWVYRKREVGNKVFIVLRLSLIHISEPTRRS